MAAMKASERTATIEVAYLRNIVIELTGGAEPTPVSEVLYWAPKYAELLGDGAEKFSYEEQQRLVAQLRES